MTAVGAPAMPLQVDDTRLTASQRAAVARLIHATEQIGGIAILCGPAGCGKSAVLARLEATAGSGKFMLVDDAHRLDEAALDAVVERASADRHGTLVLSGQGRLLTLVTRNRRLEAGVVLRATIHAMTRDESRSLAMAVIHADMSSAADIDPAALDTLHEIAGGMPRSVVSLARFARLLLEATPRLRLLPEHVEAVHRRLSTTAA